MGEELWTKPWMTTHRSITMIDGKPNLTTGLTEEQVRTLEEIAGSLENGVVIYQQLLDREGGKKNRAIIDYTGVDWPEAEGFAK